MIVVVNDKGQVVIPTAFRRRLRLKPGSKVDIKERDGCLVLYPLNRKYFREMSGILKGFGLLRALEKAKRENLMLEEGDAGRKSK